MAGTFVAINDWVHKLLRDLTRQTPLGAPAARNGEARPIEHLLAADTLPDAYFSLAGFHTLGGLSLREARRARWQVRPEGRTATLGAAGFLDATRLDRRCWGDLRLKTMKSGPAMLAGELLAYGAGTLRAARNPFARHGRINTPLEVVSTRIVALHNLPLLPPVRAEKTTYESSNVIYGDVFGELEQLWERRADMAFLDQVAKSLAPLRNWSETASSMYPPVNVKEVVRLHVGSQGLWKGPPSSGRVLLRRIEFILDHVIIDSRPATSGESWLPSVAADPHPGAAGEWKCDPSGYDGWLSFER